MIKFVQLGNNIFIGDFEAATFTLKNPRLVVAQRISEKEVGVNFIKLIGEPSEIQIHQAYFSYEVTDDKLLQEYLKKVTGLVLVQPPSFKKS